MRKLIEKLIYRKWFYAFLALVLWVDSWTDLAGALEAPSLREVISLVLSVAAALLVTLVFVDLHWRWPRQGQ